MVKTKISVLQIGTNSWVNDIPEHSNLDWQYISIAELHDFVTIYLTKKNENKIITKLIKSASVIEDKESKEIEIETLKDKLHKLPKFSAFILSDDTYDLINIQFIKKLITPHRVFFPSSYDASNDALSQFLENSFAQSFDNRDKVDFIKKLSKILFKSQEGSKLHVNSFAVNPNFKGHTSYRGYSHIILEEEFGSDFVNLGSFMYNIPYNKQYMMDLWQEFIIDADCQIKLKISLIKQGSLSDVIQTWEVDGNDLQEQFTIDSEVSGYLAISVFAKGNGKIKLGPLHYRRSRAGYGEFVLGGKRFVDNLRKEFNYFFEPGDFKPPLTVYFSGWRSAEGFEGYGIMKSLGTPFLLFADPRLVGGSFYLGSEEYEAEIANIIRKTLDYLGFDNNQLMLSGMSMGTFGALYYGSELSPHSIVISKPVLSMGDVALRERLERPDGFPTSLDVLQLTTGELSEHSASLLNDRFWNKFNDSDFSNTKLSVAYMKQDDYDETAFQRLVIEGSAKGMKVIGRGWEGRHTDGGAAPVKWFMSQYTNILKKDFGRDIG
ncbi:accessory Sec system protein Asp2 [Streptococcus pluranimalium]|uniref:accessory Sec system protein Asp2 n=1 Tax=Streptococcus pluranimalium TaxID=82348 RepID=UPI003F68E0C0